MQALVGYANIKNNTDTVITALRIQIKQPVLGPIYSPSNINPIIKITTTIRVITRKINSNIGLWYLKSAIGPF